MLYKLYHAQSPEYLYRIFIRRNQVHNKSLRFVEQFSISLHQTPKFECYFCYLAITVLIHAILTFIFSLHYVCLFKSFLRNHLPGVQGRWICVYSFKITRFLILIVYIFPKVRLKTWLCRCWTFWKLYISVSVKSVIIIITIIIFTIRKYWSHLNRAK